jgi:hypothetical protein
MICVGPKSFVVSGMGKKDRQGKNSGFSGLLRPDVWD